MPPNPNEDPIENRVKLERLTAPKAAPREFKIVWVPNVILFGYWHVAALYGLCLCFTTAMKWQTLVFAYVLYVAAEIGVTAGAHRLWSHRSYKANIPLQIILMLFQSISSQSTVRNWVRDHRLHHKYCDTDADPHNATRGFFFSHIGWILVRKHREVKERGKLIDLSDLDNNPVLRFQWRYAVSFIVFVAFVVPIAVPIHFWGETFSNSWHATMLRIVCNLHATFLINSAAHLYGNRPYNEGIMPTQNVLVSVVATGEGWHNYHHTFPWDYRAAELGNNYLNWAAKFIDAFASIGWAYDLKTVSEGMIEERKKRTGDGTNLWGWGDKDMAAERNSASLT